MGDRRTGQLTREELDPLQKPPFGCVALERLAIDERVRVDRLVRPAGPRRPGPTEPEVKHPLEQLTFERALAGPAGAEEDEDQGRAVAQLDGANVLRSASRC